MNDFSDLVVTDPKYYFLLRIRNSAGEHLGGYHVLYVRGGSLGHLLMECDRESSEFCTWLIERGATIVDSEEEIDRAINPEDLGPPRAEIESEDWLFGP